MTVGRIESWNPKLLHDLAESGDEAAANLKKRSLVYTGRLTNPSAYSRPNPRIKQKTWPLLFSLRATASDAQPRSNQKTCLGFEQVANDRGAPVAGKTRRIIQYSIAIGVFDRGQIV